MAHDINKENVFTVGEPAWHGLGTVLENPATAEEAIEYAGLGFEVEKRPLYYNAKGGRIKLESKSAMVRIDNMDLLGVVGSNYQPIQNKEAFAFFDNLVGEKAAIYHTGGVLGKGERIWILAKLPDHIVIGKGDEIDQYVLLYNSHDGSSAITACITPVRVVCNNTLTAALRGTTNKVYIRHTKNATERLAEAHKLLGISNKYKEEIEAAFKVMATKKITAEMASKYIDSLYPQDPEKEVSALGKRIKEGILNAFENGVGQDLATTKGTVYGLYNGLTYYFDHIRNYKDENSKLKSIWFGGASQVRQRAFDAALALV